MEKLIRIFSAAVVFAGLILIPSCGRNVSATFAVLPHHLLVENFIDRFYGEIKDYSGVFDTVFLISPNHFNYGHSYVQGVSDSVLLHELAEKTPLTLESWPFQKEHGIFNHIGFIEKYFPGAEIVPIVIKNGAPEDLLGFFADEISNLLSGNVLILASIDFSHYQAEKYALENDEKIIEYLQERDEPVSFEKLNELSIALDPGNPEALAMDSPESLYVLLKIMDLSGVPDFKLWKRTSTSSLTGLDLPDQNTSHIFFIGRKP